jgi:hypothetical protein
MNILLFLYLRNLICIYYIGIKRNLIFDKDYYLGMNQQKLYEYILSQMGTLYNDCAKVATTFPLTLRSPIK